jgi:hypothetical protein
LVDIFVPEEVEVSLEISVAQGTNGRDANRSWTIRNLGGPRVNTFLLESSDGCTLIDTDLLGSADKILQAIGDLGKQPSGPHRPRQSSLA